MANDVVPQFPSCERRSSSINFALARQVCVMRDQACPSGKTSTGFRPGVLAASWNRMRGVGNGPDKTSNERAGWRLGF